MKRFIFFFLVLFFFELAAQKAVSSADWQSDLRFLQETVHRDYSFLFKKTTAEEFDTAVEEFYSTIPNMEDHEVMVGFSRVIALFKYGHTIVWFPNAPFDHHKLPLLVYEFPDGIYITGAHKDYESLLGARITAVEGMATNEVLKAVRPVVPAENDHYFKAYGVPYMLIPEVLHAQGLTKELKQTITVNLEKEGLAFEAKVIAVKNPDFPLKYGEVTPGSDWVSVRDLSQSPYYLKNLDKHYYYEYLPEEKTVYVRQSQVFDDPSETIAAFYKRVFDFIEQNEVEKFIMDLRLNGGGNNYKNKPVITGIIRQDKINQEGKFFVVIGRRTFSACQNLVNELDNYTNATFIGEPTAENINFYGDSKKETLPKSKLPVYLSFAWWQDKSQWENGPHTAPHIPVDMSFEEYRSNQDPVVDKILEFKDVTFIKDPLGYIRNLFMENKFELLETEVPRIVKDPLYEKVDFEGEFNRSGYMLLDSDQKDGALYIFGMNAKLFPDSAYTWLSLAEAHSSVGNTDKAKECLNKAIDLDTDGPTGKRAQKMLDNMTGN